MRGDFGGRVLGGEFVGGAVRGGFGRGFELGGWDAGGAGGGFEGEAFGFGGEVQMSGARVVRAAPRRGRFGLPLKTER